MRMTAGVLAFGLGLTLPAAADTLPTRKPGLWESTMKSDDGSITTKQCLDANTDQLARSALSGPGGIDSVCSKNTITKTAAGYEMESVCKIGAIATEGKGLTTGNFDSAIRMEMTMQLSSMPGQDGPATHKTVIESKWLGPCEAGQKPGDMIMSNGKVIRMPGKK